jgi:Reverse transcriptase (RNA-dependent DNA polymerase)
MWWWSRPCAEKLGELHILYSYSTGSRFSLLETDLEDGDLRDPAMDQGTSWSESVTVLHSNLRSIKLGKATAKRLQKLADAGGTLPSNCVVLDTAAERSIFRDKEQFCTIRDSRRPVLVEGVNKAGTDSMLVTKEGTTQFGRAYFDERAAANILSFGEAVDTFQRMRYDSDTDEFTCRVIAWGPTYTFRRYPEVSNLYLCYPDDEKGADKKVTWSFVTTVNDRMKKYTKREVKQAEAARELQRKLYFLGDSTLETLLRRGKLRGTNVTPLDLRRATDIWGTSLGGLKGRSTSMKGEVLTPLGEKLKTLQPTDQCLHIDIMFVNGVPFLVSVMDPAEYVQVTRLKGKDEWTLWRALERHINFVARFGLKVASIRVDGESALATDFINAKTGGIIDSGGAGVHVPLVERMLRTIKERIRATLNTLPFHITEKLEEFCVKGAVYAVNLVPKKSSRDYASPREKLFGVGIEVSKDLRHGFADYVQLHEEVTDNSMKGRTQGALALMPTGALDGSWYYWTLASNQVVRRRRATAMPMPTEVIEAVEQAARKRKRVRRGDLHFEFQHWVIPTEGDNNAAEEYEDEAHPVEWVAPIDNDLFGDIESIESVWDDEGVGDDIDPNSDGGRADRQALMAELWPDDQEDDFAGEHSSEQEVTLDTIEMQALIDGEAGLLGEFDHQDAGSIARDIASEVNSNSNRREGLRPRKLQEGFWDSKRGGDKIYGLKISVKEGIETFGYDAISSIVAEVKQIVEGSVFKGVNSARLTADEWRSVIPSMLFLKEKFSSKTGEFIKLKSRLVAGGHRQDKEIYSDNSAPTVATQTVFMVATLAAAEGRAVAAVDVPGAFLKSDMPNDGPPVLMKLDKLLTTILIQLDGKFAEYARPDGTCVVMLQKALYGCLQAAKAWHDKLSADLRELGFKPNIADPCCFNMLDSKGSQVTIIVHVDDLFITASSESELDRVIASLDRLYSDAVHSITIQRGRVIEYVGMVFDFSENKVVRVTMDEYVNDLLKELSDIPGESDTPATGDLFKVKAEAEKLGDSQRERFHSIMAKVLYLAKRVRPDLLVAVAFLVRRVQCPDFTDWAKMSRLIKYIRGTRTLAIRLLAEQQISVSAYIDASYGVHYDLKSHTGAYITLGRGPVYAKSTVQRLNTKSSTEAELVGMSDSSGQVLWTRQFLEGQGYAIGKAKLYQDNQSAIALIENGRSNSERTRHIAIRYFFLTDRIRAGEIEVAYMPTGDMVADILTKPLQGALFKKLRAQLMNLV